MTKKEVAKILAIIAAAYPQFQADELKVTVWQEMLGDISYTVIQQAARLCILKSDYPPSIAAIRKAADDLTNPDKLTAAEAWGQVINAIHSYGSYSQGDALKSLPPEVAEVARLMGWQEMCRAENIEVVRGQFIKLYESQRQKAEGDALLPAQLRGRSLKMIEAGGSRE